MSLRVIFQRVIGAGLIGIAALMTIPLIGVGAASAMATLRVDRSTNIVIVISLALAGLAIWGKQRNAERPLAVPLSKQPGGRLLHSYQVSSFIVLRLYGLAFLAIAYGYTTGLLKTPNLPILSMANPVVLATVSGLIGIILVLPPLTPPVLRSPRTVLAGIYKALILMLLSVPIYFEELVVLNSGLVPHGSKFIDIVPLIFKSVAGLSITGAILVGLANQLAEDEKTPQPIYDHLSKNDLRSLRQSRM